MIRPLWALNVILAVIAVGLAVSLWRSIMSPARIADQRLLVSPGRAPTAVKPVDGDGKSQLNVRRRSISEFDSILRNSLFSDPEEEARRKQALAQPPRLPLPLLQGTILIGQEAKAILKQDNRVDLYSIGDRVAGGTLSEITVDKIVLDFGNRQEQVLLKSTVRSLPPPPRDVLTGDAGRRLRAAPAARTPRSQPAISVPAQDEPVVQSQRMQRAQKLIERQQRRRATDQ